MDKTVNEETFIEDRFCIRPEDRLTPDELGSLTPEIVIDRLRALKPFFIEHAQETERLGRPSDEVWRAVLKSGYMYLAIPKRLGGLEATWPQILDATQPLGQADPSLGWVAMFSVVTPRPASAYSLEIQEMLFKDGACPVFTNGISPTGTAKRVEGGYLVSGRWAWCTTIQFAEWFSGFAQIEEPDGTKGALKTFLMPASCVKIANTWRAHGMVGTGTHHVLAEDVFVPDTMVSIENFLEPGWFKHIEKYHNYKLFSGSQLPGSGLCVVAPVVFAAQGAVEAWRDHLLSYTKRNSTEQEKDKMSTQLRVGQAAVMGKTAEFLMREASHSTFDKMTWATPSTADDYLETRAWMAEAVDISRRMMQLLLQSSGTSVHYSDNRVARHYRDVFTGASHIIVDFDQCIQAWGERLLGGTPKPRSTLAEANKFRDEIAASTVGNYTRSTAETSSTRRLPTL